MPWESSSLTGEFYFNPGIAAVTEPKRAIRVQTNQTPQKFNAEEELWEIVKLSTVIDDYRMFLDEYPNSRFSTHARLKIQQLKRKQNAQQMTASITPESKTPKRPVAAGVVTEDGHLLKKANGVVYDQKSNLEWYVGPDKDMNWHEAKKWIRTIDVEGDGWRLPSGSEIRTLYAKGKGSRNMSPILKTTGWIVWSVQNGHSWAKSFHFRGNGAYKTHNMTDTIKMRAFAVRKKK